MAAPTYEELRAENDELKALVAQQADVITHLQAQVAALQVRWVQQAVVGALAEARAHNRSMLAGRCAP